MLERTNSTVLHRSPDCGTDAGSANFCPECGTEIEVPDPDADVEAVTGDVEANGDTASSWKDYLPASWTIGVVGIVMGLVVGALVAWALSNIGGSGPGFLLAFLAATLYLWQKPTGVGALGSGLYFSALVLILIPITIYTPNVLGEDPQTASEAGTFVGSVLGLVIWGFVFFLLALVAAGLGYGFRRRERSKLEV